MTARENLASLSREELLELVDVYSKNWLALDGLWFQSVEGALGMDAAMAHDEAAWRRYTEIEARRIRDFLKLGPRPGLQGLKRALETRMYANLNRQSFVLEGNTLTFSVLECRVQAARSRKGMPLHPCKRVGLVEYAGFARVIDDRIRCECVRCYPDAPDGAVACRWRFTLEE